MNAATRELEPREVAALLRALSSAVVAEINALPEEVLAWHPAPGEWCAKECLGHLLEAERRGFNGRIRTILAQPEPALPGWDQQAVERERRDCSACRRSSLRNSRRCAATASRYSKTSLQQTSSAAARTTRSVTSKSKI